MIPTSTPIDDARRVRCLGCGRMVWRVLRDCSCRSEIEFKCIRCASILLVTGGRIVTVTTPGTR